MILTYRKQNERKEPTAMRQYLDIHINKPFKEIENLLRNDFFKELRVGKLYSVLARKMQIKIQTFS